MMSYSRFMVSGLLMLVACHGAPPTIAPLITKGDFDYVISTQRNELRGTMRVLSDTIIVQQQDGYCQPLQGIKSAESQAYRCDGVGEFETFNLYVDTRRPVQLSRWSGTYRAQRQRTVCIQYATNAQGQQVCVKNGPEFYEEVVRVSGELRVRPKQASDR